MKRGRSLTDLSAEIMRQKENKVDYLVRPVAISMQPMGLGVGMFFGEQELPITTLAHRQVAQKTNIPMKYYDRMLAEEPKLLSNNVTTWLSRKKDPLLVRTLDTSMRAFLSKSYRPLDNYDLMECVLPLLVQGGLSVVSCEITENRLYLKAVSSKVSAEVKKGDIVQSGICISNSEVGLGRLAVEPLIYRLACLNGMIVPDYGIRKNHVGRRSVVNEDVSEFYRDKTKLADDKAFWLKVQDTVSATLKEATFNKIVDTLRDSTQVRLTGNPVEVVDEISRRYYIPDKEHTSILRHLVTSGDLTAYSLANAVTRAAQDAESYDLSTDMERMGSDIVHLDNTQWKALNVA